MRVDDAFRQDLWAECVQGYSWPEDVRGILNQAGDLEFDKSQLLNIARQNSESGPFVLTFLTKELFPLGILWSRFARNVGIERFAIAAMDAETAQGLRKLGIPAVEATLPTSLLGMVHYRDRAGFNGKALALIYCRALLIRFLVENGIDVVACDVDALFTRPLEPTLLQEQAVAFQRVAYLPKPLSRIWGFTACAGFVAYRACDDVATLLSTMLTIQKETSSDQVALNWALLENEVRWDAHCPVFENHEQVTRNFSTDAHRSIRGILPGTGITLTALPATTFWRHSFVPLDRSASVIVHPNSPKSIEGKLEVFSQILRPDELDGLWPVGSQRTGLL